MMRNQCLYVNLLFLMSILSLHLPIWNNGRLASLLAIVYTILADNFGLKDLSTLSVVVFLIPFYLLYCLVFKVVKSSLIKIVLLLILLLVILPVGSMLPPR